MHCLPVAPSNALLLFCTGYLCWVSPPKDPFQECPPDLESAQLWSYYCTSIVSHLSQAVSNHTPKLSDLYFQRLSSHQLESLGSGGNHSWKFARDKWIHLITSFESKADLLLKNSTLEELMDGSMRNCYFLFLAR